MTPKADKIVAFGIAANDCLLRPHFDSTRGEQVRDHPRTVAIRPALNAPAAGSALRAQTANAYVRAQTADAYAACSAEQCGTAACQPCGCAHQ